MSQPSIRYRYRVQIKSYGFRRYVEFWAESFEHSANGRLEFSISGAVVASFNDWCNFVRCDRIG